MSRNLSFYPEPVGAKTKKVPSTSVVNPKTSIVLVNDDEPDSFYFRLLESNNINLNEKQIQAVRHTDGPLLTIAGPGSGKTSVLTSRAGYLIFVKGVAPENILLVTFTKNASVEMKQRIGRLSRNSDVKASEINAGTFHSIFLKILRERGYKQKILSNEKHKQTILKMLIKNNGLRDTYEPEALLRLFSSYKNRMIGPEDLSEKTTQESQIKQVFLQYEMWKLENGYLDFDDVLFESYKLLSTSQVFAQELQKRFRYCLLDEAQDTNGLQFALIKKILGNDKNICAVGDPDQVIHTWNYADSTIIMNFDREFPGAAVITLDVNYRSHAAIVGLGNSIIRGNAHKYRCQLRATKVSDSHPCYIRPNTMEDEARLVVDKILEEVTSGKRSFGEIAILHRTASSGRAILEEMILRGVPFSTSKEAEVFYEHGVIKPVIDHLKLVINPKNLQAIEGVIPTLYLNREKTMQFIRSEDPSASHPNPIFLLLKMEGLHSYQRDAVHKKIKLIMDIRNMRPLEAIQKIREEYDRFVDIGPSKASLNKEILRELLDELESASKKYDSISSFVAHIEHVILAQRSINESEDADDDSVNLLTIHKAKGLEWPVVFLLGASESILPHRSAILVKGDTSLLQEERRLAFVAVTRAKEEVFISSPSSYRGKNVEISRFITEPFSATITA